MRIKSRNDIILEKIPPLLTWIFITLPFWGGFFFPAVTAYLVIIINVFFVYKSISFTVFFVYSYTKLAESERRDWLNRLKELDNIDASINELKAQIASSKSIKFSKKELKKIYSSHFSRFQKHPIWLQKVLFNLAKHKTEKFLNKELHQLLSIKENGIQHDWKKIHHLVVIPHWKEPLEVLRDTLINIKNSNYPTNKINIVLGAEARDPDGIEKSKILKEEFKSDFENIWINSHEITSVEIIGKSSNMASAGKYAKKQIDKLGWDLKDVIVTSCDADSLISKNYFANVTYFYVTIKDSCYKFFNGAILFYANVWRLPPYIRVKNSIGSLYNVAKLIRTDKFVPFSTYSISFWLVDQIGYWSPWVTPEDYHLFFKGVFYNSKKVSTIPVFQRILVDAAEGEGHIDTIKNTYFQERRWSWGISDDGWMLKQILVFARSGKLTIVMLYRTLHVLFDHITGIGMILILVLGGNIPVLINKAFRATVLGDNLHDVSSSMIKVTIWFLLVVIIMDTFMIKPDYPGKKRSVLLKLLQAIEWVFFPVIGYIFVALPGIEAHTRLLFGKYLEYYLTKKK